LETIGNEVNLAVKVKMVLYQGDVFAVWVTVAVRYFQNN
jgi:hypothetical protein